MTHYIAHRGQPASSQVRTCLGPHAAVDWFELELCVEAEFAS